MVTKTNTDKEQTTNLIVHHRIASSVYKVVVGTGGYNNPALCKVQENHVELVRTTFLFLMHKKQEKLAKKTRNRNKLTGNNAKTMLC